MNKTRWCYLTLTLTRRNLTSNFQNNPVNLENPVILSKQLLDGIKTNAH